jgi:hypothetical protein
MRKSVIAVLAAASVAAGAVWSAQSSGEPQVKVSGPLTEGKVARLLGSLPPVLDDAVNYRKPILNAAGTQRVRQGEERITIPVEGVAYEVVITKPAPMGLLVPALSPP